MFREDRFRFCTRVFSHQDDSFPKITLREGSPRVRSHQLADIKTSQRSLILMTNLLLPSLKQYTHHLDLFLCSLSFCFSTLSFLEFSLSLKGSTPAVFSSIIAGSKFFFDLPPHLGVYFLVSSSNTIPPLFCFLMPFSLANFSHFVSGFLVGSFLLLGKTVVVGGSLRVNSDFEKSWSWSSSGSWSLLFLISVSSLISLRTKKEIFPMDFWRMISSTLAGGWAVENRGLESKRVRNPKSNYLLLFSSITIYIIINRGISQFNKTQRNYLHNSIAIGGL